MAQPSKRRPWALEMKPPYVTGWYGIDAYNNEDEARAISAARQKHAPLDTQFRVRDIRQQATP